MSKSLKLVNIQVLRGIAAIAVICFHISPNLNNSEYNAPIFLFFAKIGYFGVDIFFVVSGFIMMKTQLMNPRTPHVFFIRRLIRIIPMYYLTTLLLCLIYYIQPGQFDSFKYSNLLLFSSLTFTSRLANFEFPLIILGWTLEFEIFFYLVLAVVSKLFKGNMQIVILTIVLGLLVVSGIDPIILEFLIGIFCAMVSSKIKFTSVGARIVVGFGLLSLSINFFVNFPITYRTITFGIPAFILVLGMARLSPTSNHVAVVLGNSSYSTYLVQTFTIPIFFFLIPQTNIPGDLIGLAAVSVTILTGHFFFWKIERFLEHQIYRRFKLNR